MKDFIAPHATYGKRYPILFKDDGFLSTSPQLTERGTRHYTRMVHFLTPQATYGERYQTLFKNGGFLSIPHNLSLIWHTDGVSVFKKFRHAGMTCSVKCV